QKDVPIVSEWIGTLDGSVNAQIRAQVTGFLLKQDYKEGEAVKKGDVLFEIDSREFQAAFDRAQAQLGEAEARFAKTEQDGKRYTPLAKENAISQQELDNAIQANRAAESGVAAAKASLQQAQLNLGYTKVTSLIDGVAGIAQGQVGDLVQPITVLTVVST